MSAIAKEAERRTEPSPVFGPKVANVRRTATDDIFEQMYDDIISLRLKPGTKVSEVEIAKQFEVSRQPVREAFIRLANMGLLSVRPQRATVVKKISLKEVADSRFVRMAIEVEVARVACELFNDQHSAALQANLELQKAEVEKNNFQRFRQLDADFHRLLCVAAGSELAYRSISESKSQVDRLCAMSLSRRTEFKDVYLDHVKMVELLKNRDADALVKLTRTHLARLDATIEAAIAEEQDFFEA